MGRRSTRQAEKTKPCHRVLLGLRAAYWAEVDYRLAHFGGEQSFAGRLEPVFRMQLTFRSAADPEDGLPVANTQRVDFALDYHLPHEVRINTSYSRELSAAGNRNVWQTGIVYRFLIPLRREK